MQLFPLFIRLEDRSVLLIGGGEAALAKYRLLKSAGARVEIITPDIIPDFLNALLPLHHWHQREANAADIKDQALIVVATGLAAKDQMIAKWAREKNIPVNVVDRQELGNVVMPAIVDRSPLVIAISTDGASPVLGQKVRTMIEEMLPANYGRLAEFARRFRSAVAARIADLRQRRMFWDHILSGPVAGYVLRGQEEQAHRELIKILNQGSLSSFKEGRFISLVIGDWEDLTLGELRLIRQADGVIWDDRLDPSFFHLVRREAKIRTLREDNGIWIEQQLSQGAIIVELRAKTNFMKATS